MKRLKLSYEYVIDFLLKRNIEWLNKTYDGVTVKSPLCCLICSYKWETTFHKLKRTGCPNCSGNAKHTYEAVKEFLIAVNIELLSDDYENNKKQLSLKCLACGCLWSANFHNIKNGKRGCTDCATNRIKGMLKYKYEDVEAFLLLLNIKLLSTVYINKEELLDLHCMKCQHYWKAKYGNIRNGKTGCPNCWGRVSRQEKELFSIIKNAFPNAKHNIKSVLANKRFELDIYVPERNKAIEFNGEYWHLLPEAIKRDEKKKQQCSEKEIELLVVWYNEWMENKELVIERCLAFLNS